VRAFSQNKCSSPGFAQPAKIKQQTAVAEGYPGYLNMDNSSTHSRYSEQSQSQQSYQVSPEPTIHHQEQEDTTSDADEDKEREPPIKPSASTKGEEFFRRANL
jgi:hypothetical protein